MTNRRVPHSNHMVIAVGGHDAAEFLQGQFTNDVGLASTARVAFGAFCNPKGRVVALATIARRDDRFWLITDASVGSDLVATLKRYVLRSDVSFAELEDHGAALMTADASSEDPPWRARTEGAGVAWRLPAAAGLSMAAGTRDWLPDENGADDQDEALLDAGLPTVVAANRERFTPQMLNLDLLGGISFDKGCYTGQEIVARTQHLGTIKRRMLLFSSSSPKLAAPGTDVVGGDDKRIGTVVCAAVSAAGQKLLAVVRLAALDAGSISVAGQRLTQLDLPYPT